MALITGYHHWQYFLALESDLINLSRYIEFSGVDNPRTINARVHSIEIVRIFLAACAESENIFRNIAPPPASIGNRRYNIKSIKDNLQNNYNGIFVQLVNTTIQLPTYNLSFNPWQDWNTIDSPKWWSAHNKIKHNRTQLSYKLAHVHNTLNSVAGLMSLLFHAMKDIEPNSRKYHVIVPPALTPQLFIPNKSGLGFGNENWAWED
ncbi:MAG: hypothetical protein ACRCU2_13070 [Planktothrix sp.]